MSAAPPLDIEAVKRLWPGDWRLVSPVWPPLFDHLAELLIGSTLAPVIRIHWLSGVGWRVVRVLTQSLAEDRAQVLATHPDLAVAVRDARALLLNEARMLVSALGEP